MNVSSGFGEVLARLLDHRRTDVDAVSNASGVAVRRVQDVVDGMPAGQALLGALAPVLDLHEADLFALARLAVPDALAPLDASASRLLKHLVPDAICLAAQQRTQLLEMVRSLPQQPRERPYVPSRVYEPDLAGFGAVIGNMLYGNRNFGPSGAAVALACCSNGRMYVSPATIMGITAGRFELTPERLADLATLLDVPADVLAAASGIPLPEGMPPEDPAAADTARLVWDVRRLTANQLQQVCEQASIMRSEIPDEACDQNFYASRPNHRRPPFRRCF
ncbi:hypothetical protein [Actinomadura rupiterrae]|uniref:hypothetical protein n=1 Tax=Actinomadura rupiterrae TaxID=559627 RepID=UPI0020A41965|nr:hypothetical protein [Actinomadura rupiterrae]MCP2336148.1 hypothetical protein [Actinomadura rupiterrae]